MSTVIINGAARQQLPVTDRSISYGDGAFETIACVHGRLQFWEAHMQRLQQACERLALPPVEESLWLDDIRQLDVGTQPRVIKLILSRGTGGRGYRVPEPIQSTRIVSIHDWPDYPAELQQQGGRLVLCRTPISMNPALAGLKHLNRLDNVLARSEWQGEDIIDGLMLDMDGHVVEGTMSNVFAVEDGRIYTPSLDQAGVAGVIRRQVMVLAEKLGYECQQVKLSVDHLRNMDELFITNSLLGICPIHYFEDIEFSDWPLVQELQKHLDMDGMSIEL